MGLLIGLVVGFFVGVKKDFLLEKLNNLIGN